MATQLSQTTKLIRKAFFIFIAFIIIIYIIDFIINSIVPKEPVIITDDSISSLYPKANNLLGTIPKPKPKSLQLDSATKAKFSKDKVKFSDVPTTIFVYKINAFREQLEDAINARATAKKLGFNSFENYQLNNILYWETTNKNRTFSYDKINKIWLYNNNSKPQTHIDVNDPEKYKQLSVKFTNELDILSSDFSDGESKLFFINKDNNNRLTSCNSKNNCSYARIDLFKKITQIQPLKNGSSPIKTSVIRYQPTEGIAQFTLTEPVKSKENITTDLKEFKYKEFSYETEYGIYNTVDQEKAFNRLQNDEGFLIWLKLKTDDTFSEYTQLNISEFKVEMDKIQLVYIEPDDRTEEEWTQYLQPYYVFQGTAYTKDNKEADFKYIVPALANYR